MKIKPWAAEVKINPRTEKQRGQSSDLALGTAPNRERLAIKIPPMAASNDPASIPN
jgi:hypothetical protein